MLSQLTAEVFRAFILGAISVVAGGFIFEGGKRYVKVGGSNQFKGKVEALPFFFLTIMLGYLIGNAEPVINSAVYSIHPLSRLGIIGLSTMVLFNYSISYYNYTDIKSLSVYAVSGFLAVYPYMG